MALAKKCNIDPDTHHLSSTSRLWLKKKSRNSKKGFQSEAFLKENCTQESISPSLLRVDRVLLFTISLEKWGELLRESLTKSNLSDSRSAFHFSGSVLAELSVKSSPCLVPYWNCVVRKSYGNLTRVFWSLGSIEITVWLSPREVWMCGLLQCLWPQAPDHSADLGVAKLLSFSVMPYRQLGM